MKGLVKVYNKKAKKEIFYNKDKETYASIKKINPDLTDAEISKLGFKTPKPQEIIRKKNK